MPSGPAPAVLLAEPLPLLAPFWTLSGALAEVGRLRGLVERAVAALNEAPDPGDRSASKREAREIADANQRARVILTEDAHPPARRRTEDAA